ncbi:hypothetical protein M407DRAFT_91910 [Tulasnella calospora MUT 4182]|uniref:Uncharacterized protein n=1 Tax=Tulasnella calospora MUT 4182 TaxID=1051891 RepID=A0A0C3Q0P7_9AGAM|nr:hypothetical protein M407DRAFT_91910 [Tulasnella calospora MUT 4182]
MRGTSLNLKLSAMHHVLAGGPNFSYFGVREVHLLPYSRCLSPPRVCSLSRHGNL